MAKSSLAGVDGALTWVVSAARADALFVGRGLCGRGLRARRGGRSVGLQAGPIPECLFSLLSASTAAAEEFSPETSGCTERRRGPR